MPWRAWRSASRLAPARLDLMVNNAGITRSVPHSDLDALDDALIDDIFRVNVRGAIATVRAMRPLLAAEGGGLVVNISSVAGRTALGSNIAYCASKAALDNVTMSLARALAPQIRVVSVSPGWVEGRVCAAHAACADSGATRQDAAGAHRQRGGHGRCGAGAGDATALHHRRRDPGGWRSATTLK